MGAEIHDFPGAGQASLSEGYTRIANNLLDHLLRTELSGLQQRVMLAVLRLTYGYGKSSDWLSPGQIAEALAYQGDIANLRRELRQLVTRGLLLKQGRAIGPNPNLSQWQLGKRVKTDPKTGQNRPLANGSKLTRKRVKTDSKTGQNRHPPKKDQDQDQEIPLNPPAVSKPDLTEPVRQVIAHLNVATGRRYAPRLDGASGKLVVARLNAGASVDDLLLVVDCMTAQWLNHPTMERYLRPETLFRASKFEGYLVEALQWRERGQPRASPPSHGGLDHTDMSWINGDWSE
ncbi:replication protein [Ferrimonas pelagia]|uniref:Phage replication protein O n=1 Tax=Ferrimonas pelagia TaxID=1177826 RepID=A0ABP9ESK9_9GAMM